MLKIAQHDVEARHSWKLLVRRKKKFSSFSLSSVYRSKHFFFCFSLDQENWINYTSDEKMLKAVVNIERKAEN